MSEIAQAVRDQLRAEFLADRPDMELADDLDLIEAQIIDSLGIFIMVAFLETRFGVSIEGDDINPQNFETVPAMTSLVERAQAAS
ncbi:MAG: acyl carrier protein [Acidimicrobiia bacterium]|nr:acyl carrier protein [Acidimicrobiia bacterium]NNF65202.1 acyl carrier protein [Acidimicrobiia bacterium]